MPHPRHDDLIDKEPNIVASADTGGRKPQGPAATVLVGVALLWSLFQFWYASPLPFAFGIGVFNDTEARALHLAFAVFLGFLAYPAFKRSHRGAIPLIDWMLALAGAFCMAYLLLFYAELAARPGQPTAQDLAVSVCGLLLLLEAARRALGLPMVVLACLFIAYIFLGPHMPEMIAHKGASLSKAMSHLWLSTEGVFGVALGVSTGFIFLFVLFGALLETAGAGNYFIKSAISLLGHLRGGPAKAAVVASAATGMISGSSIANVVTTGTFTIPLMKRVGYRPDKAGAVEVAASVDGQIMPPVMGAAAFLMVEYVGIPYTQVLKHAFLPALISYLALFYIVHLEAMKAGIHGLPRRTVAPLTARAITFGLTVSGLIVLAGAIYFGLGWIKRFAGDASVYLIAFGMLGIYVGLVRFAARHPELHMDDPNEPLTELPPAGQTLKSGLHFLLPVAALIWNLLIEELSPALSAFWAICFLMFIVATQQPLFAWFRGQGRLALAFRQGWRDLYDGLAIGARNMISIGIATAAAGIIVGTVTLTGIGLVMTDFVETVSGGNLLLMLLLVAAICLILGMGLPTTANYIVVSTLMAPVVVEIGAENGLLVPLIAVHLFVFYFGLMADVTPPVGLASYAAAGIARCDPIRTGITAFGYSIRTAILPFMFIFNAQLLLIDVHSWWHLAIVAGSAILANLLFAAATQGWFLTKSRWWESALLLAACFTLFRPGFWMDMIYPPFESVGGTRVLEIAHAMSDDARLRLWVEGLSLEGEEVKRGVLLPLGPRAENGQRRLDAAGIKLIPNGDTVQVLAVKFGSRAEKLGIEQGFTITAVELPAARPAKEWVYLPALLLVGLVMASQRRRIGA
jgi:TRAP transporter 4TM/12TM fusion protein